MNNWKCFAFIKIVERATGIHSGLFTYVHRFCTGCMVAETLTFYSDKEQGAYELPNNFTYYFEYFASH